MGSWSRGRYEELSVSGFCEEEISLPDYYSVSLDCRSDDLVGIGEVNEAFMEWVHQEWLRGGEELRLLTQ